MKVLIVDDSEIDTLLCQKIVESLGYTPIAVSSADEAFDIIQQAGSPDIIIADWFMPNTTGLELCKKVRNADLLVEPFILMMTSNHDRHAEAEALNAGADDFISKPVNRIDMEAKLKLGRRLIRTQLELLVANQRLSEKLRFDEVTGILNRQSGLKAISAALSRLSRQEKNQGLLVHCHIRFNLNSENRFKHDFIDKVYFDLARDLTQLLRQSDVMVRFRDDEFLFFAESEAESHQVLLNRIEKAIRKRAVNTHDGTLELSSSIAGLVIQPEQGLVPVDELLLQTENVLKELQSAGTESRLVHLSHHSRGQVLSLAEYRRAQSKN
jgi:diguanylate cyclase (GGDEF)-like protein